MTLQEFKKKATSTKFNNCNAWGFGGSFGTKYELDNLIYYDARWSHRHTGTSNYSSYYMDGKEVTRGEFINQLNTEL